MRDQKALEGLSEEEGARHKEANAEEDGGDVYFASREELNNDSKPAAKKPLSEESELRSRLLTAERSVESPKFVTCVYSDWTQNQWPRLYPPPLWVQG